MSFRAKVQTMKGDITTRTILFLVTFVAALGADVSFAQADDSGFAPVTDAMLNDPDPADWLMCWRTLSGWGYSPLDRIDRDNVADLRMVWTRPLREGIQEGTPLIYDGIMYFPNPADVIQALDAATGELIREYVRPLPPDLGEYGSLLDITRNIAMYGRTLIDASTDGHMYAVDTVSGELVWETRMTDYREHTRQHSSGPIVANGTVFAGGNCQPRGGPEACMITAHDAGTGEELWRTYTIPRPGEPGYETWGDVPYEGRWHVGTWMPPSYDPDRNRSPEHCPNCRRVWAGSGKYPLGSDQSVRRLQASDFRATKSRCRKCYAKPRAMPQRQSESGTWRIPGTAGSNTRVMLGSSTIPSPCATSRKATFPGGKT